MRKRPLTVAVPVVLLGLAISLLMIAPSAAAAAQESPTVEYLLLATTKTSTLEKELNEASGDGFRFLEVMGGETAFGGDEAVAIMERVGGGEPFRYEYKLLATNRTGTMQKEAQEAADAGYHYRGQTVFSSLFGGNEVVLILERDVESPRVPYEIKLLATSRTSTMQKELSEVAVEGFEFVGFTVGETAFGGNEVVSIMRRSARRADPASVEPAAPAARPTVDIALDAVDAPAAPPTADVVAMRELMQTGAMRQDLMLTQAMAYIPARDGNSFTMFNFEVGKAHLTLDNGPASMLAFGVLLQRDPAAANGEQFMRDIKSTFAVSPDEGDAETSATHSFGMTLPPGDYRLAWGVMDKGSENIATTSYEFRVPDYASEGLEIPSVLVAAGFEQQPDAIDVNTVYSGTRVGNLTLNTNLDNEFGRDDSLRLLYFVKGLAVDQATRQPAFEVGHRILVAGTEETLDRRPPVPFNTGAVDWEIPLADVAQLEPGGVYEIEIHITDQLSGAELIKRVPFTVRANQDP